MKVLVIDNLQENEEARRQLRESLRRHFPPAHLDYAIHEARAGAPLAVWVPVPRTESNSRRQAERGE